MTLWKAARARRGSRPPTGVAAERREISQVVATEGAPQSDRPPRCGGALRARCTRSVEPMSDDVILEDAPPCPARRTRRAHGAVRRLRHADPVSAPACSPSTCTRARPAGLFDVSHMGQALIEGPDHATVAAFLETLCPADLLGLAPGRQRYTQFLNDDGGIVDDLMVTRPPGADGRAAARRQRRAKGGRLSRSSRAACRAASASRRSTTRR